MMLGFGSNSVVRFRELRSSGFAKCSADFYKVFVEFDYCDPISDNSLSCARRKRLALCPYSTKDSRRIFNQKDGHLRSDWGICANATSPRCGLLTFEHQGCPNFKFDSRWTFLETAEGKRLLKRFNEAKDELEKR
jgi:hypothetical protein